MKLCMGWLLQRFRPITLERPKVLLPLAGFPFIDYTLEWLASNSVAKVRGLLMLLLFPSGGLSTCRKGDKGVLDAPGCSSSVFTKLMHMTNCKKASNSIH